MKTKVPKYQATQVPVYPEQVTVPQDCLEGGRRACEVSALPRSCRATRAAKSGSAWIRATNVVGKLVHVEGPAGSRPHEEGRGVDHVRVARRAHRGPGQVGGEFG